MTGVADASAAGGDAGVVAGGTDAADATCGGGALAMGEAGLGIMATGGGGGVFAVDDTMSSCAAPEVATAAGRSAFGPSTYTPAASATAQTAKMVADLIMTAAI
ncbi:hypothetical protein [Pseudolabrys sp. Root1462]|uniref:hypothetical protein n=1 Tax=Pseudolabrys sp. Root1462 TaxID=1736466 RepID=UPI00138EFE57|nr:hypothetical protein [Pseudolabrys sp. Root1462]